MSMCCIGYCTGEWTLKKNIHKMHLWNLIIKTARICSQCDFESMGICIHWCGLGGWWFEGADSLAVQLDYPSRSTQPPESWHSGLVEDGRKQHRHREYCFNRSSGSTEKRTVCVSGGAATVWTYRLTHRTGGAWRPSGHRTHGRAVVQHGGRSLLCHDSYCQFPV